MNKEVILKVLKAILVVVIVIAALYLGIYFTVYYRSKLDKTKPVFMVEENIEKISGKVTSLLKDNNDSITILVENREEGAIIDKVKLSLDLETTTVIREDKLCKITDIEIGQEIEASFEKTNMTEYPIKAKAKKIEILK